MYSDKRFLAIIPARSGSKGLPHKNIKLLNDKPMIAYTIEAAIRSGVFDEVIVSTDDIQYAEIAKQYGATVPFLRDKHLAQDQTTTTEVIVDLVEKLKNQGKEYDYIMVLQPTSPLRRENDIIGSVKMLFEKNANTIVSMCECEHPIEWTSKLEDDKRLDGFLTATNRRRQEEGVSYRLNGAIYLTKIDYYLKYKDFYREDCYAYIMDKYSSIDVDDIYDFKYAEVVMSSNIEKNREEENK